MSISAKERKEIPNREMGVPSKDKYPLDSPEHIKSAAHLINHGHITSDEKKTLANKILRRAREEGVSTDGMNAVKQIAKVSEQVPPMSDGTSLGNAPPRLMAPYYDEQDEMFSQLDKMDTRKFILSPIEGKRIVSEIHNKVKSDSKPPTGNQNCQLCTWCAEAQCRGMKVLPRPVYSPRDPALEIKGEMIVAHPYRNAVTSFENLMNIVSDENADYGRFYVHVGWKGGTGGHEFLIVGLNVPFIMDAQQGYFESMANPKVLTDYFNDVDWSNSYICRLDDKPINSTLLNSMNNMNKLIPWDPKLDIPYMKEHGMLNDSDMAELEKRGWLTESQTDESFIHEYVHQHHLVKVKDFPYETLYIGLPEGHLTNDTLKHTKQKFFLTPHKRIASAYTCSMKTLEQVTGTRIWDFICEDLNSSRTIPDNQMYDHLRFTVFTDDPLKTTRFENLGNIFAITDIDSIRDYLYIDTSYTSKDIFVVWGLPEIHVDYVIPCVTAVEVKALPTKKLSKQNQKLCVVQEEVAPSTDFRRVLVPSDEGTKYLKEDPECKQYWEDINKRSHGEFLIDIKNNKPIGHVFVHTYKKNKGFIYNLEVSPEYRRQGYGMILTDDAVRRFGGEDLTVDADNKPAIKMYLKYGFEIYKKGQWHYDPPKDELWMKYDRSKLTQESTNIFESGHFAKYKDDVLGFNDEGMAVMKKCKCGGKISITLKGEPIYMCESCGKYYGTVPCNIQEAASHNVSSQYKMRAATESDTVQESFVTEQKSRRQTYHLVYDRMADDFIELPIRTFHDIFLACMESDFDKIPKTPMTVKTSDDTGGFVFPDFIYDSAVPLFSKKLFIAMSKVGTDHMLQIPVTIEDDIDGTSEEYILGLPPRVKPTEAGKYPIFKSSDLKDNRIYINDEMRDVLEKFKPVGMGWYPNKNIIQEGAFQDLKNGVNPYSDKMVFHVTPEKHADGQIWKPRVPDYLDPYNPEETGFEDNTTPRICFSTSIEGCLNGITVNLPRQNPDQFDKMYIYIPEKPWKEYKHKTNKELVKEKLVYDANVTREVWITEPVRMKLYGVIQVDQVSNVKRKSVVPTSKGEKGDRNYFTYKWHWVVKPKVLEKGTKYDYSQENVIADLCIDLKKFKYGLIKDGKLQTGNVSESDYEKYWVFHSGQEVDEAGGGNCWDMVEYESGYLDAFGVPYKKYFMNFTKTDGKTPINTHTFCVIPHNGKFIYIEQAFKRIIDEWGHERQKTFDSLKEIFQYIAEVSAEYNNQDLNYGVWDYTNAKIDYGTPANEFCNWIMSKCKMVYDGEAKKPEMKTEMDVFITIGGAMFYVSEYHNALFDDPDAYAEAVLECGLDISDNESYVLEAAYGPYDEYLKKHKYDPKSNTIEDPNNPGRRVNAGRIGSNKERNRMNKFLRENGYDPKTETILTGIDDRSNPGQKKRVKFGINSAIGNPGAQMSIPYAYGRVDSLMTPDDDGDRDKGIAMSKRLMQQKPGASNYILKHEEGHLAYDDAFGKETNGQWNANPSHHSPTQYRNDITDARQHIRTQVKKNPALKENAHDMLPTEYQADKYGEEHNPYGRGYGGTALRKMMSKAQTFDPDNFSIQREAFLEAFGKGEAGFKAFTDNMREQYDSMLSMMKQGYITKSTPGYAAYKKSAAAIKREIDSDFPASRKVFFSITQPDRSKAMAEAKQRDRDMIDAGINSRDAFMKKYETRAKAAQEETAAKKRQLAKEQLKQQIASGQLSGDQAAKAERKIQRIEAFEASKQQPVQQPQQPQQTQQKPTKSDTISVGAQDVTKPTVKKEGYRVSRFGNLFQEADEKLSETEDITIGDLNLDDNDDIGEDGPGLPGYMEDRMSDDDLESYKSSDDDFEIPEEGDFESYKVSDEKLDAARGPIDRPQPDEEISVTDVDLGSFGKDTSDIQNEYDPKEVTILMKLMASEADAMNEYMDGAKETNVDVLRRLYADIANEERFHMEQLLYAKCELTGEKYVPKDPEVKSEYEELLKMGMDEETAMATAVDRCHIRGSIADDDTEERIEIQEDITQMESVLRMFDIMYDHTSMILESKSATPEDVDRAMSVFTEACLMQEATYNATSTETEKSPLSKANKFGPLQLLRDTLRFLIRALMTIIRKFVEFIKRIHNRSREIRRFVKQYGIKGLVSDKVRMYFIDLKQPQSMYINNDVWFLLSLAVDTTNACASVLRRQGLVGFTDVPRNPKLDIRNNIGRGVELLNGVQLIKSPMVIPDDEDEQQRIAAALFGYTLDASTNTKYYGDDGKSVNTLNTMKIICDRWVKFMQNVLSLSDSLSQLEQDKTSIYYTDRKKYDTAVKGLETVTKTCKAMISALQNDINVIIKLDNEAADISIKKTEALDSIDIKTDARVQGRANAYEQNKRTPETSRNAPVADRFKR